MDQDLLENFSLTKNARFYKKNAKTDKVTQKILTEILDASSKNRSKKRFHVNTKKEINEAIVYTRIFETKKPVYFYNKKLDDIIHAFVLIVQVNDYLVVFSKSCSSYKEILSQYFDSISYKKLSSVLTKNASIKKLNTRNMTISPFAVRGRGFEAYDLENVLSKQGLGRSIPTFLQAVDSNGTKSIFENGRLVEFSSRNSIASVVAWVKEQIIAIEKPSNINNLIDSLAQPIALTEVLDQTKPLALLINEIEVINFFEKKEILFKTKKGKFVSISNKKEKISAYIQKELEKTFDIDHSLNIKGTADKLLVKKNTLKISSKFLQRFFTEDENKNRESLNAYINRKGLYSVTFECPKYMYFLNKCYEDISAITNIDNVIAMLTPHKTINLATSEKGKFRPSQTDFDSDSLFSIVEKIFSSADYLFCDDLGNEWADHIALDMTKTEINFIHSKYKKDVSNSASYLQDVIGQAMKNFGNMFFSKPEFKKKKNSWNKNYIHSKVHTNISRIRKSKKDILSDVENLIADNNLTRKCILCCSFISKKNIESEFKNLKKTGKASGYVIQLLWILSSFSHAAKEMGVIPIIYCQD